MRSRDPRYKTIKPMMTEGSIKTFSDVFIYIPMSVVAKDIGKKNARFSELITKVGDFKISELQMMAELCNIEIEELFHLIAEQMPRKKKSE